MSFGPTHDSVEELVKRIIAGEAVFFVGAGFSLDSQPNTTTRLIRRLIARFAAITEQLAKARPVALELREGLRVTFSLGKEMLSSEAMVSPETIDKLAQDYYKINDWICSAFTILLGELKSAAKPALAQIRDREDGLLANIGGKRYDTVPLDSFDVKALNKLGADSGKGLFLETMGFANVKIWGAVPLPGSPPETVDPGAHLLDRQRVIAWLAREGLAPLILTTNFDLLLEGAGEAAGFEQGDPSETEAAKPPALYDRLVVISGPTDFFRQGSGYRTAMLVKIHGCVGRYREERKSPENLARYLRSMVFTYREIQNWRKDSWSRDLVSTLLRTRSIVLCGYSGADAVIHDTFRTVYEEILANRPDKDPEGAPAPDDTRAFFTGAAEKGEFAGLEILRAGSRAAGVKNPPLFGHKNYLPFYFTAEPGQEQKFPTMDELFLWIYHRTLRRLQLKAIGTDLCRVAALLLHRNVAPADVEAIRSAFEAQCKLEIDLACDLEIDPASNLKDTGDCRRMFAEITAWTSHFHPALLREFALLEAVARNRSGHLIEKFRSGANYFPLLDRPGWGAWGAVVELALRRMAGSEEGRIAGVVASRLPVALVATCRAYEGSRTALVLRGPGGRHTARVDLQGLYRRIHSWEMTAWLGNASPPRGTPCAQCIWEWSFMPRGELGPPQIWFGESDELKNDRAPKAAGGPDGFPVQATAAAMAGDAGAGRLDRR